VKHFDVEGVAVGALIGPRKARLVCYCSCIRGDSAFGEPPSSTWRSRLPDEERVASLDVLPLSRTRAPELLLFADPPVHEVSLG
jgi:hypothetical protein